MLIISSERRDKVNKGVKKIEEEGIMGKPESFSLHSSILHAVDLFLKLHRHKYGKKIRKHSHRRGESASPEKHPENIYLDFYMCVCSAEACLPYYITQLHPIVRKDTL